jgi:hypothetical protein
MSHCDEQLLVLLRFALGLEDSFALRPTAEEWTRLYEESIRHSLVGVTFVGVNRLRGEQRPPLELLMQWASESEALREVNLRFNQEAARVTRLFESEGHKTAILKGQANARLYPDVLSRQPGDIDIWVSGGKEVVIAMLKRLGMADDSCDTCYHHIQLPHNGEGIEVEVHFLPSSGHNDKRCNELLQRYLAAELERGTTLVEEGFRIPSMQYALMMQLAHIRHHLRGEGVGLRQLTDYLLLLRNSTEEERCDVAGRLKEVGLLTMAQALMWVLAEAFYADKELLPVRLNKRKGHWMLEQVFQTGNFGHYDRQRADGTVRMVMQQKWRLWRLAWFEPQFIGVMVREEWDFWWCVVKKIPERIRYRSLSLRDHPEAWG